MKMKNEKKYPFGTWIWAALICVRTLVFASCEQGAGAAPKEIGTEEEEEEEAAPPPELSGIRIGSPPETLYYARGQSFTADGLEVIGIFDDGTEDELPPSAYSVIPPDMSLTGPRIGRVVCGEYSADFAVIVNNSDFVLQSITVTAPPGGIAQYLGQSLNTGGLTVTGAFTGAGGVEKTQPIAAFSTSGYDRTRRGEQTVTVSVNGKTGSFPVTVKVPKGAAVKADVIGTDTNPGRGHDTAFIKGQALSLARARIRATVTANGVTTILYAGDGIADGEIEGFDPGTAGKQMITLKLDEAGASFDVYVAGIEPEVYFDHGFMRTREDPTGRGKNGAAFLGDGAFHTVPGKPLALSPARVLVGYNADHTDAGATYEWTFPAGIGAVSGAGNEFLTLTPQEAGSWEVFVSVTGRNYVDGQTVTKSASAKVVCDPPAPSPSKINLDLRNFSPGQFTESGNGYGWSLGSIGGYWTWSVKHQAGYAIGGNGFISITSGEGWVEPGVVWFQEDSNGNGKPDEAWYELDAGRGPYINRLYSVKFFKYGEDVEEIGGNEYGQTIREIYWADGKGRTGRIGGGWPKDWGVNDTGDGAWVTYTSTILCDDNKRIRIDDYDYKDLAGPGGVIGGPFVDRDEGPFPVNKAVDAAGRPVTLTGVRFIKVQNGIFRYGGIFGEVSTEITGRDKD
ncbi:MAG: bacterial Ig-like domain-containing protein [Spirochaetaceae bacterium]|jgi:hypothetical protein|nr:bacterial Ig-like domain-containing protein [Spirochaetaceae bacterium]